MKPILLSTVLALAASTALANSKYVAGDYQIDPMHSKVGFEVPHLVISTVEGTFSTFAGTVTLAKKFQRSKVSAEIDVNSINTGVDKRDQHLRSADFFQVSEHPKMNFTSQKIKGTAQRFQMTGPLTIKGKTQTVTFQGKYLGSVIDGFGQRKVAFEAKTTINRKDFGLTWNNMVEAGPVVGDEIELTLKIQAAQPAKKVADK